MKLFPLNFHMNFLQNTVQNSFYFRPYITANKHQTQMAYNNSDSLNIYQKSQLPPVPRPPRSPRP